jgi:hypothetical protein
MTDTRDILNSIGETVGQLTLPAGTSEETWSEKLAAYSFPVPVAIEPVSPRQIRQALYILSGLTDEFFENIINTLPDPTKQLALIEWKYATVFERDRPLVDEMRLILGWTAERLDQLWIFAATL